MFLLFVVFCKAEHPRFYLYSTMTNARTVVQFCVQATGAYFIFLCFFNFSVKIVNFVTCLNIILAFRFLMFRICFCLSTKCKLYQIFQQKSKSAKLILKPFVYIHTSKSRLVSPLNPKGKLVKGTSFALLGLQNDLGTILSWYLHT